MQNTPVEINLNSSFGQLTITSQYSFSNLFFGPELGFIGPSGKIGFAQDANNVSEGLGFGGNIFAGLQVTQGVEKFDPNSGALTFSWPPFAANEGYAWSAADIKSGVTWLLSPEFRAELQDKAQPPPGTVFWDSNRSFFENMQTKARNGQITPSHDAGPQDGTLRDAGPTEQHNLSTYGTDSAGAWSSQPGQNWSASDFNATHTNAPGTTLGPGGNDAGSTNIPANPNVRGDLQHWNKVKSDVKQAQTTNKQISTAIHKKAVTEKAAAAKAAAEQAAIDAAAAEVTSNYGPTGPMLSEIRGGGGNSTWADASSNYWDGANARWEESNARGWGVAE